MAIVIHFTSGQAEITEDETENEDREEQDCI